jgi:hypothetical protein
MSNISPVKIVTQTVHTTRKVETSPAANLGTDVTQSSHEDHRPF